MSYTNQLSSSNLSSIIGSSFGLLGSFIVIISCYKYKKLNRTLSRQLISCQSISHFIETFTILFLPSNYSYTCIIQGILEEYSVYCGLFWGCLITYLLLILTKDKIGNIAAFQSEKYMKNARIFGWVVPIPLTLIPLITNDYSRDEGGWCWFRDTTITGRFYRLFHYIIVIICIMFIVISSFRIYSKLSETLNNEDKAVISPLQQHHQHHQQQQNSSIALLSQSTRSNSITTQNQTSLSSPLPKTITNTITTSTSLQPIQSIQPIQPARLEQEQEQDVESGITHIIINWTPQWLTFFFTRNRTISISESTNKMSSRLIYFPIVLIMCYTLITLHRFWQIFGAIGTHNSEPPNILLVIGIGIVRAQGLFDLILFSFQSSVRKEWSNDLNWWIEKTPEHQVSLTQYRFGRWIRKNTNHNTNASSVNQSHLNIEKN